MLNTWPFCCGLNFPLVIKYFFLFLLFFFCWFLVVAVGPWTVYRLEQTIFFRFIELILFFFFLKLLFCFICFSFCFVFVSFFAGAFSKWVAIESASYSIMSNTPFSSVFDFPPVFPSLCSFLNQLLFLHCTVWTIPINTEQQHETFLHFTFKFVFPQSCMFVSFLFRTRMSFPSFSFFHFLWKFALFILKYSFVFHLFIFFFHCCVRK